MIDPNLITTIRTGELPPNPPTLESKIPHELGTDLNFMTVVELVAFLQPYIGTFQHEVKILHVDSAYISDNFDGTGLGKNICLGWAIMNGQNGTENVDGTVSVAYGSVNSVIGQTGGEKTKMLTRSQIPSLDVTLPVSNAENSGGDHSFVNATNIEHDGSYTYVNAANFGVGQTALSLMQPFRIELHIIKL
jgi:hypothetical protein